MIVPQKGKANFDIGHLSPRALTYSDVSKSAQRKARPLMSCDAVCDVMIGSSDWLKVYGLAANKISLEYILPASGFKHSNEYDDVIKKNVCSKYGDGYFDRYLQKDGKVYNLTGDKQKVQQFIQQINSAISVYKERLEWLTNGSRRFFGVIQEKTITIIIDVHTPDDQRYLLFISALKELLHEQVSKLDRFNLVRTGQDVNYFSDEFVSVNNSNINAAIEWIDSLNRYTLQTTTCVAEAVSKAFSFATPSSKYGVYLFTENGATDGARELLKSKISELGYPLHTVSYNSTDEHTIRFLRKLAQCSSGGRFHAFSVSETDVDPLTGEVSYYGGTPSGSGTPEEIMLIWNELEAAKDILYQLETINQETCPVKQKRLDNLFASQTNKENFPVNREKQDKAAGSLFPVLRHSDMQYMDSKTWLHQNGIKTRGLDFYAFLGGVAFRHCDGVVKQSHRVEKSALAQTNENDLPEDPKPEFEIKKTLINAKYCEKFVHVLWKDGRVRHVQVTGKMFRDYEIKMNNLLKALNTRINWLCQGSRELFGTICEEKVYILIDTSASMESRLKMVKDKLYQLMQEQLRHKVMFNIVAFDSHVKPWRDALVNVTEAHLRQAWDWVKDVETGGSTNTLGALKMALGDNNTQAVYLLSDGRPDQLPKSIYAQACLHPRVPVHTISFNCHDKDANIFLKELAEISRGRFHIFHDSRTPSDLPKGFQSEDLSLLKKEADEGKQSLRLVAKLRAECAAHEWSLDSKSSNVKLSRSMCGSMTARPYSSSPSKKGPSSDSSSSGGYGKAPARKYRLIDPQKEMQEMLEMDSPRVQIMRKTIETMTQYSMDNIDASGASTNRTSASDAEIPGTSRETWLLEETQRLFQNQKERRNQALRSASELLNQIEISRSPDTRRSNRKSFDGVSLKQWIKANGLVTKRLTIIDALSKTLITQKPMFVPSIDKVVLSRVFDDILPISYATTRQKNEIHLVNPAAVDLKAYESRLTETIQNYYEKLDGSIWESLPFSERQGYNNIPPNWETDRASILESLQRCNWPISREDLRLVDDEIELGKKFLQQSIDLRLCSQSKLDQPDTSRTSSPRKSAGSTPRKTNQSAEKMMARAKQTPRAKSSSAQRTKQPVMQEVTAKVELSQDEINLVHFYRQKMRQNSLQVKSVPGFRPTSGVRKVQNSRKLPETREESDQKSGSVSKTSHSNSISSVSKLEKKISKSSRSSISTSKSVLEEEDQRLDTPKNSPSTGYEASPVTGQEENGFYSYEDTFERYETSKTEASKSNTGRWNQSSVDREENQREVIGSYTSKTDDMLLHNILKEDERSRMDVPNEPEPNKKTPSRSLDSSSAIAQDTGYLDEDDFFDN